MQLNINIEKVYITNTGLEQKTKVICNGKVVEDGRVKLEKLGGIYNIEIFI